MKENTFIFKLNTNIALAFENQGNKVRLVVYNNGVENICRKSTLKTLDSFIQSGDNHLFKGRL